MRVQWQVVRSAEQLGGEESGPCLCASCRSALPTPCCRRVRGSCAWRQLALQRTSFSVVSVCLIDCICSEPTIWLVTEGWDATAAAALWKLAHGKGHPFPCGLWQQQITAVCCLTQPTASGPAALNADTCSVRQHPILSGLPQCKRFSAVAHWSAVAHLMGRHSCSGHADWEQAERVGRTVSTGVQPQASELRQVRMQGMGNRVE